MFVGQENMKEVFAYLSSSSVANGDHHFLLICFLEVIFYGFQ